MLCYVILHYNAKVETINCINSIKNNAKKDYKIIVVDNSSPNGSGLELKEQFGNDSVVDILLSKENLGFAKGNNLGCSYAKKYNPDFIIVMNSDVLINQGDFDEKIYEIYEETKFDILGPKIFCPPMGVYQNPKRLNSYTISDVEKLIKEYKKKCNNKFIVRIRCFLKKSKLLSSLINKNKNKYDENKEYKNIILHGSCVIFSNSFINKRKECFNPQTFMYYEMEILDYECKRDNLLSIYSPKISVIHNHNASTNYTYKSEFKKVSFMNECILESLKVFLDILKK